MPTYAPITNRIPQFGGVAGRDVNYPWGNRDFSAGGDPNPFRGASHGRVGNENPFWRGHVDPETAYQVRKKTKRIYAPAMAALVAQNALLGPTAELERRGGELYAGLFGDIAPQYLEGYRGADPETSGLLSQLTQDASSLVGRSEFNPYEDRELQQQIAGAQSSRGLALSPQGAYEELINLDRAREQRRIARGQYAAGIQEQGRQYYAPALMGLLGRYQSPVQGTSTDDLLSLSLNDTAQRRNEQASRRAGQMALWGSAIESVGAFAGAAAGACWVAEELYGVDDVRTHLARAWVRAHPENAFVKLYQKHGKAWARWLKAHPWAKPIVAPVWDSMWQAQVNDECRSMTNTNHSSFVIRHSSFVIRH